jgi:hypothetical protein
MVLDAPVARKGPLITGCQLLPAASLQRESAVGAASTRLDFSDLLKFPEVGGEQDA